MSTEHGEWQIITPIQEHISVIQVKYIHVHNSTSYINNNIFKKNTTGFEIAQARVCITCTIHHCNTLQWLQKSKFLHKYFAGPETGSKSNLHNKEQSLVQLEQSRVPEVDKEYQNLHPECFSDTIFHGHIYS